ncbi:DUF1656 domain-containing protein [uncultured Methylobacterium sp.]|uniref:DUF1656 domain-containing protein n=1 Tax=uncultured Methylobacterium sp. TaxID=157278 RepID=UPI0026266615|nr:DUF1656 domain-containing protein [uncultured Methylobacterium sp.]
MIGQIDLYGIFVPALLAWALVALLLVVPLRLLLARAGFYRLVWHRPLFDLALYVVVLGLVVHLAPRFVPGPLLP